MSDIGPETQLNMAPTLMSLDIPKDVGDWLTRSNALSAKHIKRSKNGADSVEVDQSGAQDIVDGTTVCRVMNHYSKDNNQVPSVENLKDERTAGARLHNWNMLTVGLAEFGVQLDPDMKGLIVGGDTDVVVDVLRELRDKTQNGARRRRPSADTGKASRRPSVDAGQQGGGDSSSEVSLDLKKLDTCQNLEESSNALDFLVISMCKKLGVRAKQAAALLTANTKYLSHMMEKGIKGSFDAVDAWYAEVFKNNSLLADLMASHPSTIPFVLSTLKWAFTSENEESAQWMCRIFANLAKSLQQANLGHVLHEWLVQSSSGQQSGLTTLVKCLKVHPDTADSVYGVIMQLGETRLPEVFEKHLPRLLGPQEYMELVAGFLPVLRTGRSAKGEVLLGRGGLVPALVSLTIKFGGSENTDECRVEAFGLLANLWSECAEELAERKETLDSTLDVLKKGTRASSTSVAHEAQTQLFTILDALGGVSNNDGLNAVYRTLVFIMLELPNSDPLHGQLSQQLAERLRKNTALSPSIVVEPLVKQLGLQAATEPELEFLVVIAGHNRLGRQHGAMIVEVLGTTWAESKESGIRTQAGDAAITLVGRFRNDTVMAQAIGKMSKAMLAVFGKPDERSKAGCAELLGRVAQLGGNAIATSIASEATDAVGRYGDHDKLEALINKLGGPPAKAAQPPKEPNPPKGQRKPSAGQRRSSARDRQAQEPAWEGDDANVREVPKEPARGRAAGRAKPNEKPSRPDVIDTKPERETKPRRERRVVSKSPTDRHRETTASPPPRVARRESMKENVNDSEETEEQRAVRKKQQAKLRAKRLDELRAIKQKREDEAAGKALEEQNKRARSADIKEQLAKQRQRDYERNMADRAARKKAEYDRQLEEEANPEKPIRSAPDKLASSKKPFWERESAEEAFINKCVNKYPHDQRIAAREVCEVFMDIVDCAIDPAAHFKKEAEKKKEGEKKNRPPRNVRKKRRTPSVEPSEKGDTSGSEGEAEELLQARLDKEKARLERAERAHAKIAAYRERRAAELHEMAEADKKLDAMKKHEVDKKKQEDRRRRDEKKEEVRRWREQQAVEEREKKKDEDKREQAHKRERARLVQEYLDRKDRREQKKKVDMETIQHDKDEEEANKVETANIAEAGAKAEKKKRKKKEDAKKTVKNDAPKEGKADVEKEAGPSSVEVEAKEEAVVEPKAEAEKVEEAEKPEEKPEPAAESAAEQPAGDSAKTDKVVAPDGTEEDWSIQAAPAEASGEGDEAAAAGEEAAAE